MKKKIRTLIIVLVIILFVLLLCLIGILSSSENEAKTELDYINNDDEFAKGTLTMSNPYEWYSVYKGKLDSAVVDKSLYRFATKLVPEYLKITNTSEYFKENSNAIKLDLGITSENEFTKLVKSLEGVKGSDLSLEKYSVCKGSVEKQDDGIEFAVAIQYKEKSNLIVKLRVSNQQEKGKSSVKYMEESSGKYDDIQRDEKKYDTTPDTSRPGRVL